jgi:methylmalonyl-CoA/ethylmalonyl-CoA epimerase
MGSIRFDHIAIAQPRIAEAVPCLVGILGGVPAYGGPAPSYRFFQWRFDGGGRLEVLEPLGDEGFLHRFLAKRGPGVHHVTFKVPDLAEACHRARALGYDVVGYDASDPHWKQAFLHPRQALGIVVQLAEAHPRAAPRPAPAPFPGPVHPPPPVRLLGLRLRARSRARADRQWRELLEGTVEEPPGGGVIYRWPGSPTYLAVDLREDAEEGPVALEIASERPLPLGAERCLPGVRIALVAAASPPATPPALGT